MESSFVVENKKLLIKQFLEHFNNDWRSPLSVLESKCAFVERCSARI